MSTEIKYVSPERLGYYDQKIKAFIAAAVLGDISKLYNIELGGNILAAVPDQYVPITEEIRRYAEEVVFFFFAAVFGLEAVFFFSDFKVIAGKQQRSQFLSRWIGND